MTKKKTNTAHKKTAAAVDAGHAITANDWFPGVREASTLNDTKNALIIVSLTINAFFFIAWIVMQITTVYDAQVYTFLFNR